MILFPDELFVKVHKFIGALQKRNISFVEMNSVVVGHFIRSYLPRWFIFTKGKGGTYYLKNLLDNEVILIPDPLVHGLTSRSQFVDRHNKGHPVNTIQKYLLLGVHLLLCGSTEILEECLFTDGAFPLLEEENESENSKMVKAERSTRLQQKNNGIVKAGDWMLSFSNDGMNISFPFVQSESNVKKWRIILLQRGV